MDAKKYCSILEESLLGTLSDQHLSPCSVIFQQDDDRKHTSNLRIPLCDECPCSFVIPLRLLHTTLVGFVKYAETIRKDMLTIVSGCFPKIPKIISVVLNLVHPAD